jgi:hypothetical protein
MARSARLSDKPALSARWGEALKTAIRLRYADPEGGEFGVVGQTTAQDA